MKIGNALRSSINRILAVRQTTEPREPDESRIPYSGRTLGGTVVTPDTAVTVPAVWACLRYLSQTVAVLPWHVMRETESGGELAKRHPVDWLLWKRPNPEWSAFQFRETLTHWALRWGNGYAEIERDGVGRPIALWPVHPERVEVKRDLPTGRLVYEVNNGTGGKSELDQMDVFHIRGFGEGPVGVNVISYAAESIGWARALQLFGSAFFGNGMNVNGVFQQTGKVDPTSVARTQADLENKHKGGPRRWLKALFVPIGLEWKSTSIEPNKGQFIEANQHLVDEICRWFGVPPHKVAHLLRSTNNNIEHQGIEVVVDSIAPWVKRFEDEADYKLFGTQNRLGFYTKINMNALMRGDVKSRGEYYKMMREVGAFNANRILQLEDENTIGPAGDKHIVQSQYTTLERIGEEPATDQTRAEPPPDPSPEERQAMAAIQSMAAMMEVQHVGE
ncbi:phage portal protein [Azospirillum himalayense]|uniref:Phage portal protein n=1 Tax=Azospirillum himalayense TaxID=654847 RepID=A0ABW0FXL1_9PROT